MPTIIVGMYRDFFLKQFYSSDPSVSVLFVGIGAAGVTGTTGLETASVSKALESTTPEPLLMATLDNKIRTNIKVAKAQVLLSKKSVVFFTPPNCCVPPPPKEEDKPPPFGF